MWAHSGNRDDRSDWETLPVHLTEVGDGAAALGLSAMARVAGLWHDLGKYHPDFQARLAGSNQTVDHSTAGGALLMQAAAGQGTGAQIAAEVIAYAILGHHAGLPDMQPDGSTLRGRTAGFSDSLDPAWRDAVSPDLGPVLDELKAKVRGGDAALRAFDLSLMARMVFSCLVDADFKATERFYARLGDYTPDRDWPALQPHIDAHLAALDARLAGFDQDGPVNTIRREVMAHVRARAVLPPGPFTLTVPTGGGKTLASLAFALEHARRHGHRRIIYVIPYTSIIDQTATEFRNLLGADHILEHHASIDTQGEGRDEQTGRNKLRLAMQDWAAPVIVTTAVQFFESLFAARTSSARKLHAMANSVIVLDEVQTLPRGLLAPSLRMLDGLGVHYGASVVLCTATQPALDERLQGEQLVSGSRVKTTFGLPVSGRELAPDPVGLNTRLRRTRIVHGGVMADAALVDELAAHPQSLIVVNTRAHALALYRAAAHLDGMVHLTTRQCAADRSEIIAGIRARLKDGQPCRVISTSLIEAGVDVSFRRAWRAEAGLEQIIQVAGRVNRNDEYDLADSIVTVFTPAEIKPPGEIEALIGDFRTIMATHEDLQSDAAIEAYFRQVYWRFQTGGNRLDARNILSRLTLLRGGATHTDFAFRSIAADFRMIDSAMVPIIIPESPEALSALDGRLAGAESSGTIARDMQRRIVQVPPRVRDRMIREGVVTYLRPDKRSDQFAALIDSDLYRREVGLEWEETGLLSSEEAIW
ncbi:MAG: CRISPR-associated endonuclease Cas3'' [Paracoccus sp. (in: a-proteobacteria)]|uniref:CRISPR-associated endonuclease Cas3'' n=1 Tax=Paracoccus sp. TaxID=267 RepID=UPI0026DFF563|nr:CRISPR-associated endonuclease Cas3'' [Paracoccus sp. (in: a-proteobacteria)]MDO5620639.1 CRISPR-associated endonuclease Cas3'' [Paracoccus sp. (in: a-proteobacteria)]